MAQDDETAAAAMSVEVVQDPKRRKRSFNITTLPQDAGARASRAGEALDPAAHPDWWEPQPRATLDSDDYQDRPYAPIAASLSCALCHVLLREAMTAPECGHSYCYDCIEARVEVGGNHNVCPLAGCGTVLGPNPFDHHRLMYDTLLDSLVQKIFPRPELDAALASRRAEREEATRRARAEINGASGRGHRYHQQHHHQQQQHNKHPVQQHNQQQQQHGAGRGGVKQAQHHHQQQRVLSPRGCGGGGGMSSPDGGEEGDDEGSDPELRRPSGQAAAGGARRRR